MIRPSYENRNREQLNIFPVVCASVLGLCLIPLNIHAKITDELWLSVSPIETTASTGPACELHGAPQAVVKKSRGRETTGRRPQKAQRFESEHRPTPVRTYYLNSSELSPQAEAYALHPDGSSNPLKIQYGPQPTVTLKTPMADDRLHGANNIYVIDKQVNDGVLEIQSAKWLFIHHSCGWGHDYRNDQSRKNAHALEQVPLEIVINGLWDGNFHADLRSGDELELLVTSAGVPVEGANLTVTTEKQWSLSGQTDKNGIAKIQLIRDYYPSSWATFKRSQQSRFTVTATYSKNEIGQYNGQPYQQIRYTATFPWKYSPAAADYNSYAFGLGLGSFALAFCGIGIYSYRERRKKPYKGIHLG